MFYRLDDEIETITVDEIDSKYLCVGFVSENEMKKIYSKIGITPSTIQTHEKSISCCSLEIYNDRTILKIGFLGDFYVVLQRNFMLVVELSVGNGMLFNCFMSALYKFPCDNISNEKLLCSFLISLIDGKSEFFENTEQKISTLEEDLFSNQNTENINPLLLKIKRTLLQQRRNYQQLISVITTLKSNENEVFTTDSETNIDTLSIRLNRTKEEIDSLQTQLIHLQDAYQAQLELKLNQTMKNFTKITTVFFPLTLIVGWYGMNFDMPELHWKYGYWFVLIFSVLTIIIISAILKIKGQK